MTPTGVWPAGRRVGSSSLSDPLSRLDVGPTVPRIGPARHDRSSSGRSHRLGRLGLDVRTNLSDTRLMTGADFIRRVRKLGRIRGIPVEICAERDEGSHRHLYFGERLTVVPDPKGELKKGTLHAMLKQLGLTLDELTHQT